MTTPRRLPLALTSLALVAGLAMSGCSKNDDATSDPSASATKAVAAPPLPSTPAFKKSPAGALVDVKVLDCPTAKGEQTAKLELTNSAKAARDYSIMVIWLKNGSGEPRGSALVKKQDAAPGKKIPLEAKGKVVEDADKCVLQVLAGDLK
ncbi:MAG TPA: hypothetical protein H9987_12750 [Candidatus Luteococcus avicola]|nr:hypothetical protein [Candidatus Luteococcus avicola]